MFKPSLHSRAPRRGQALILAVLVMLFAVLLSSAFLVVIGNTGRQIVRENDRSEASRGADKAVSFVVARLRSGDIPSPYPGATPLPPNPDTWNPQADRVLVGNVAGVPQPSDADYDLYYSPLDKAMGWAGEGYVKYPDPRRSRQAPQFLVSSHLLGTAAADDSEGGDKRFMLRITVIGLSSKNPETWSRRTLYKTTNWNGATFSYANFVTSFDPDTQKPISSTLAASVNAAPALNSDLVLPVNAAKGQGNERVTFSPRIAEIGNTLMVSDGQNQPLVGVVKSATLSNSVYSLTVRVLKAAPTTATPPMFAANAKVALVGSLFELPTNLDANGDNGGIPAPAEGPTQEQRIVGVSSATYPDVAPFGNGAQYNLGLNVPLTTTVVGRQPVVPRMGATTLAGQNSLSSSGPVSNGDPTPIPAGNPVAIQFANGSATPIVIPQAPNAENQFLKIAFDGNGNLQRDTANSAVAPVIAPRTIRPAPIDFASYRARSTFYINNPDDVEKFNGQPLSSSQLQRLWQRKSFRVGTGGNTALFPVGSPPTAAVPAGAEYARLCYGRPGTDAYAYPMVSGSLEQRGIRGWTSPWEFLPRGPQVILNGTKITVIADPLSDNSSNAPDTNKAFPQGTRQFTYVLETDPAINPAINPNLPLIIAADGNLRLRGNWTGRPLTIVSGNNVYIEGSIIAAPGRVAPLAKKNVVLNPSQFVARPSGTVDTSVGKRAFTAQVQAGTVKEVTGKTFTASTFKIGDKFAIFKQGLKADGWHEVTGFDNVLNPTAVKLTPALNTTDFPDGTDIKVKLVCDPPIVLLKDNPKTRAAGTTPGASEFAVNEQIPEASGTEANTQELDPTINAASTGTSYAYKFAVGGDILTRTAPFGGTIGIAMRQAAQKSVIRFSVRGGDKTNPLIPNPPDEDDGVRQLVARDQDLLKLMLAPKPGAIKQNETFDFQDLDANSSLDGDDNATFGAFNTIFTGRGTNRDQSRWMIEDLLDAQNQPSSTSTASVRRLAKASIIPTPNLPPNTVGTDPEETPNQPTTFRAPLTSSVLLFNSNLPAQPVASWVSLLNIGSRFDFQSNADAAITGEDTATVDSAFYGKTPVWNIPTGTTYAQSGTNDTFAFTRDGAGDYNDRLPSYYLSALHFQKVDATTKASIPAAANAPKTNMAIEVDATIYAEGGSWFVIPVPTPNANGAQPTDADQQIEWRRPAYQVTINGNIAQMMTPTATLDYDDEPDADGVATGAMKRWTDSLSYQVYNGTNPPMWQTIRYRAAPLPAFAVDTMGNVILDANGNPTPATISQLPASSDILYRYSN